MHRYALRDDQWDRIKDFLPGREGHVGGTAADNRLFVEAVVYRYRTGIPWRSRLILAGSHVHVLLARALSASPHLHGVGIYFGLRLRLRILPPAAH